MSACAPPGAARRAAAGVVADAVHHVAAAEALRVLERDDLERAAGQQVDELEHDGRRAEVDGDAVDAAAQRLDRLVAVVDDAVATRDDGVDRARASLGSGDDDPEPAAQRRELDVGVGSSTTAWQASRYGAAQERFGFGAAAQRCSAPLVTSTMHSRQRPVRRHEVGTRSASSSASSKSVRVAAVDGCQSDSQALR